MRHSVTTPAVHEQVQVLFPVKEERPVIAALETTGALLPRLNPASVERVLLAILHLSGGDMMLLRSALAAASRDWRDVLVAAGLAGDNWVQVLGGRGITPSLSTPLS